MNLPDLLICQVQALIRDLDTQKANHSRVRNIALYLPRRRGPSLSQPLGPALIAIVRLCPPNDLIARLLEDLTVYLEDLVFRLRGDLTVHLRVDPTAHRLGGLTVHLEDLNDLNDLNVHLPGEGLIVRLRVDPIAHRRQGDSTVRFPNDLGA